MIIAKTWQERALEMAEQGMRPIDIKNVLIEERYLVTYDQVRSYISRQKAKKVVPESQPRLAIQNQEPNHHTSKWDGTETIKFAVISDTHIGSKYTQLTFLHEFYNLCKKEGIADVYHSGDLTEGLKMRVGHEYELYTVSADDMRDDIIKNYPCRKGVTTHFIIGNHDASIYKQVGYDIGQAIANARSDMKYLGRDCAVINLTPNCTLELRHPWDGMSYSMSYRPQKMIESMESDSKPNILVIGHYHKALYMFYRNVHCLLGGCFQAQTPFERGKGISVHLGGWIVELRVDKEGTIQSFKQEFVPFYASVKDDYKNFKR
jgi:predicted phosphodiesterase